jgi:hypothetical protein
MCTAYFKRGFSYVKLYLMIIKTNIIYSFVSFPLFSNIVVKYMNRLELFVDQFISINDTLCVF